LSTQTIELLISPAGEVVVQTKGFVGASCQDASRFLEQALGEKTNEQKTAEFYQQSVQREQAKQHS